MIKVEGKLSGTSLPSMWRFGEWVASNGKTYKVTNFSKANHTIAVDNEPALFTPSRKQQFLKILCKIALIPWLCGVIARRSYRRQYTAVIAQAGHPMGSEQVKTPSMTANLFNPAPPRQPREPRASPPPAQPLSPPRPRTYAHGELNTERFCWISEDFRSLRNYDELIDAINALEAPPENTRFILLRDESGGRARNRTNLETESLRDKVEENRRNGKKTALIILKPGSGFEFQPLACTTNDVFKTPIIPLMYSVEIQRDETGMYLGDSFVGLQKLVDPQDRELTVLDEIEIDETQAL